MKHDLTSRFFWLKYWKTKNLIVSVKKNYPFSDIFINNFSKNNTGKFIEIGGFPGYFAIYFRKYLNFKSSLLDYVIDRKTIAKLLKFNELEINDINILEKDFFKYKTTKKYDVVFSSGFIEHFENFSNVIKKHWQLTNKNGTMLIILPNLLGLNGHIQLLFDPNNLNIHNLQSMDIKNLDKIVNKLKPKKYEINYYGGLSIWLEDLENKTIFHKIMVYSIYILGKVIKMLGLNSKFTSPFIYILAKKK